MQIDTSGDITSMTPDQWDAAMAVRIGETIVARTQLVLTLDELVGQQIGAFTTAAADATNRTNFQRAVAALNAALPDFRRGLLDEAELFRLQSTVVLLGLGLYAAPAA